jgi:hypothetical protein
MFTLLFWNSSKDETGERLEAALPFAFGGEAMERKRVAGRFVREGLDGETQPAENKGAGRAPGPKQCRTFTRAKVAEALPEIVECFVEEAKKGSIAHAKMLTSLGGLDQSATPAVKKRRGKSTVGRLLERMAREPRV